MWEFTLTRTHAWLLLLLLKTCSDPQTLQNGASVAEMKVLMTKSIVPAPVLSSCPLKDRHDERFMNNPIGGGGGRWGLGGGGRGGVSCVLDLIPLNVERGGDDGCLFLVK